MNILNLARKRKVEDEEEGDESSSSGVSFYQKSTRPSLHSRFFLDESIGKPSYYRPLIQHLMEASEGDVFELFINSHGGNLDTAVAICSAIQETQAKVVGVINGAAYSAAGSIALACHQVAVLDGATFMCHEASYGSGGKGSDIKGFVDFSTSQVNQWIDSSYKGFLSVDEIKSIKAGKEIWMLADEIRTRLIKRQELQEKELKKLQDPVEAKPKRAKKCKGQDLEIAQDVS